MRRPQTALVLIGVLALVGGGTALAGKGKSASSTTTTTTTTTAPSTHPFRGGGPHGPSDDLQAAATYLGTTTANLLTQLQGGKTLAQIASATDGKSTAGLIAALVAAEKTEIADAVKANKLTQAQADAITANLDQRFTDFVNGVHPDHGGPGGPHGFGDHGPPAAAATYLGISQSALATQLQAGRTLAQIANATSGKSAAGLIAALVADAKQHFGSNVPSDLEQRITDLVNGVRPAFGPRDGDHDHGPFGGSSA